MTTSSIGCRADDGKARFHEFTLPSWNQAHRFSPAVGMGRKLPSEYTRQALDHTRIKRRTRDQSFMIDPCITCPMTSTLAPLTQGAHNHLQFDDRMAPSLSHAAC